MRSLCLVACLASTAAADHVRTPTCGEPKDDARAPRKITDVDWCNHDFGMWKGRMRAGHSEVHLYRALGQPHDTLLARLRGVVYGDVDGDGTRDAAIVIEKASWYAGRSEASTSTTVYVYAFVKGAPALLGSIPAGTPVHELTITRRGVSVTSGQPKQTSRYRWDATTGDFTEAASR